MTGEIVLLENGIQRTVQPIMYKDLHGKGLGKSFEGVGINQPVIITLSDMEEPIVFGYSKAEMERRAHELSADMNSMILPPESCSEANRIKFWFSPKISA